MNFEEFLLEIRQPPKGMSAKEYYAHEFGPSASAVEAKKRGGSLGSAQSKILNCTKVFEGDTVSLEGTLKKGVVVKVDRRKNSANKMVDFVSVKFDDKKEEFPMSLHKFTVYL